MNRIALVLTTVSLIVLASAADVQARGGRGGGGGGFSRGGGGGYSRGGGGGRARNRAIAARVEPRRSRC